MKRILVPTDFSEQAHYAFEVAVAIARRTGAAIKLLHVIETPAMSDFSATGDVIRPGNLQQVYVLQLLETTKGQMKQLAASVKHEGVDVVQEVDVDKPISKIRRTIQQDNVDLVVMGSKGSSGLDEFLLGSNTEKVVRTAECPVLTVKHRHLHFDVREIVVASDFKREISHAMARFKHFQQLFGARLHLVYINTPGAFESSGNLHLKLEEIAKKNMLQNYTTNVYDDVLEEEGIMHFAQDIRADLIMLATHGRTGFSHLLSGSIAEDLVNHTRIPVLTFQLK
ncbi:universal stress protein [Pontibacter sp. E15-1]|uniref:universal stress protein n=1 Tax=Pontibacter sp. E15-1 TaxID=2919918 RepID=UPI001F4F2ECC|nr:universal stress protein [Pontibacter sp. E15-1]MCJ8163354.1 universal stress protein [Pontibacter sp. E15-1]